MKSIRHHGPVLLLLLIIVFGAFGPLINTPLWSDLDFEILCDAHQLAESPLAMFEHIGGFFSQPVLQLAFLAEYRLFGIDPTGYIAVNLFIHAMNSFLVYMLVNMLFARKKMAILAAVLFAFGVGNYCKILMNISQLEALLLAQLHLLVLYFFIRNDFRHKGRIGSPFFILGMFLFLLAGLTRASSFSLLGCLLAYQLFFYKRRSGRQILSPNLLILLVTGVLFYIAMQRWGFKGPTVFEGSHSALHFTWISFKNIFRYLNLMFFPLQHTPMLEDATPIIRWLFEARTVIRIFLTISILSYSFFGFVFGNSAVRFFIAWTYISLLPFTGLTASGEWLNLNHLYLTSLGFCVILAAGTRGTCGLLAKRHFRKYIPLAVPIAFCLLSLSLTYQLNARHVEVAETERVQQMHNDLIRSCQARPYTVREKF